MLIRAFQIHVRLGGFAVSGRCNERRCGRHHGIERSTGIEPHIERVVAFVVASGISAQ